MNALALQDNGYAKVEPLGPAEKAEIIDALYKHYTMQKVVEATSYDLRRIMVAIDDDPEFQTALSLAEKHLSVLGEDELKRRAIFGIESPVVANGRVVYTVEDGQRKPLIERKYSDTLLTKYLEANRRDKYGAKIEITATHKGVIALPAFSPEMMQLLLADARGEDVELIVDQNMTAEAKPEPVIEAEFTVLEEDGNPEGEFEVVSDSPPDDDFDIL